MLVSGAATAAERDVATEAEQTASRRYWSALNDRHLESIAAEESRNGPYSAELIELFTTLGLAHQEYGLHTNAVDALQRALQVKRVNEGLHTLDQVPLLRQLLASELAVGNVTEASELQERLLELAHRHLDDARAIPILRETGDRHVEAYERYLAGEAPPLATINGPTPSMLYGAGLRQARDHYWTAINSIWRADGYSHEELVALEQGLTRTFYLEAAARPDRAERREWLYDVGRESHQRRLVYTVLNAGSAVDYAKAIIELADWTLLFAHNGTSVRYYDDAYTLLIERSASDSEIDAVFPDDVAVRLPTFVASPLASTPSAQSRGYVDVAFELSKYGRARDIEVVGVSDETLEEAGKEVARTIAASRFRPKPTSLREAGTRYESRYYID